MHVRPTIRYLSVLIALIVAVLPSTAASAAPAGPAAVGGTSSAAAQGDGLIALKLGGLIAADLEEDSMSGDGDEVRVLVNGHRVWPWNDGAFDISHAGTCVQFVEPWVEGTGTCGQPFGAKGGGYEQLYFKVGEQVTVRIEEDDLVGDDDLGTATVTVDGTRQVFTAARKDGRWPNTVDYSTTAALEPVTGLGVWNLNSGKCLEIRESSDVNGAVAQQWGCVGQDGARWVFERTGSGVLVRRAGNGKCLEIDNSKDDNGARAQQWDCKGQDGTYWKPVSVHFGALYLVNESGKCLEVQNSSEDDGARIQQWDCVGQPGAVWYRS
ncbi:RICIN domain-containing protein [Streptomyces sp. NPDC058751]|uniref:RICIN domain-containing protein n=1 Tax=Streptomyces sp. NPDC058751 TaxID=3346623 RepID=UPI0036C68B9A